MSESPEQIDARLAPQMEYFGERLNRLFSYFFCVLEFEGDEDLCADSAQNTRAWSLQIIVNACIDASLIALRDLDDFLQERTSKTKPDDIRASDFGFTGSHSFLTQPERERINKCIAHFTTVGVTSQPFRWDILELATKAIAQCVDFLKWVETEYNLTYFNLYTAALLIRKMTESRFKYISDEAEKRRRGSS
jgi:hypothetical protein